MNDAIRPDAQAARAILFEHASGDNQLFGECSSQLQAGFSNHPHFPRNLKIDNSSRNAVSVKGKSAWAATKDLVHLPPFQHEAIFRVAWDRPTLVILTSDSRRATTTLPDIFGTRNQIPVLLLAWAYILAARWAELIPTAHLSQPPSQPTHQPNGNGQSIPPESGNPITVHIGEVDEGAAYWWNSILSDEGGWEATMCNSRGDILYSPWSTRLISEQSFVISAKIKATSSASSHSLATSTTAHRYLSEYRRLHGIDDQKQAALAAALLIPVAKFDCRPIELAMPKLSQGVDHGEKVCKDPPVMMENNPQLDRLLTLSCNPKGSKALLTSIFFEPDVTSNICGMWLRGSFAFLNSVKDPHVLLKTLMKHDPGLGGLWIDLNAAAWTETFVSFIQAPVPAAPGAREISRADECRLLYLCRDLDYYSIPPLFPFAPFGSTALVDTNLDVHEHALCGRSHCLGYTGFTWLCQGEMVEQGKRDVPLTTLRPKCGEVIDHGDVGYDDLDSEDENSEMVTRNIFTWLREQDGFPVAERAIREHEWIENLEDDDDSPIEGDVRSTAGEGFGGWLLKTSTQRSYSL
ncbi:hypothetical protein BKA56DRAFT_646970 [Ilyonectria sp. MPI-CAGE-AT-0026]|nr:hypothetical protein BKA56DRAFT_646970 [Ilyonectria sp. MPI-CAGE-AT-0026]